jgi:hypothetical protein
VPGSSRCPNASEKTVIPAVSIWQRLCPWLSLDLVKCQFQQMLVFAAVLEVKVIVSKACNRVRSIVCKVFAKR